MAAFLVMVGERCFTRAARKLSLSQSALSQIVRRLEARFSLRLLGRPSHGGGYPIFYLGICRPIICRFALHAGQASHVGFWQGLPFEPSFVKGRNVPAPVTSLLAAHRRAIFPVERFGWARCRLGGVLHGRQL